jgi:UDP-N-acetylmuramoyl-L-alanyl-D-glutamate--2,6-diaminopimelate ligase
MLLSELINGDNGGVGHIEISGLAADSRAVRPGYLFAALPGHRAEGTDFIADAVAQGAVAVLAPTGTRLRFPKAEIKLLHDANPRRRLAQFAAKFYAAQPQHIAAVTGTNGKTSTVDFARQMWLGMGLKAASIGTLGIVGDEVSEPSTHTTPDPVTLHATLARLATSGIDYLAIEASSHGLHQHRLDGVEVSAAAFTNLSRDHLDYHASADRYLEAKWRLFEAVMEPGGVAVLNADSTEYEQLRKVCTARRHKVISYGRSGQDIRLRECRPFAAGQDMRVCIFGSRYEISLSLVGGFQADNVLCALGLVLACGCDVESVLGVLPTLKGVPGRVEEVARHPCGASIYVDYAHTPNALDNVLETLRQHTRRDLVVVFGCGGDRDRIKRGEMGRIAAAKADRVFITDDNPRSEDPARIRGSVLDACPNAIEIGDRTEAIHAAIQGLRSGDVLVVAGKGHETGQIVADKVIPFDDREVVRDSVAHIAATLQGLDK